MEEPLESILPQMTRNLHRLSSNVFSPQTLEGSCPYLHNKKEKNRHGYHLD